MNKRDRSSTKNRPEGPTQRQLRVGEEMRHVLADIFRRGEVRDPGLHGVTVTVTEVRISPDLKNATAFVMPLAGQHAPDVIAALRRSAPFVRGLMAKALKLRVVPTLGYQLDTSFDHASRIDQLLHRPEVARDLAAEGEPDEEADGGPDDQPKPADGA